MTEANMRKNAQKLVEWFLSVYERPEENTPRDDGEWVWICGGPYHLREALDRPPGFTKEERSLAAVMICEDTEMGESDEWAGQLFAPDFKGAPPRPPFPVADRASRSRMSFSAALEALKIGKRVARSGWNGKGMWLVLVVPWDTSQITPMKDPKPGTTDAPPAYLVRAGWPDADRILMAPWIGMKTVDEKLVPWLASQTDILAEDWELVV